MCVGFVGVEKHSFKQKSQQMEKIYNLAFNLKEHEIVADSEKRAQPWESAPQSPLFLWIYPQMFEVSAFLSSFFFGHSLVLIFYFLFYFYIVTGP